MAFTLPRIIQGGMGAGVSSWQLARAVALAGQLGVVSGTSLDVLLARRLQMGDPDGHMAAAMARFPLPEVSRRVWDRYFVEGGVPAETAFVPVPMHSLRPPPALVELTVLANFVEVSLAKAGHDGLVGINLLEKIQLPTLPSLFGAMLAGVDCVLMGAGIPRSIPGILDDLAAGRPVRMRIDVEGAAPGEEFYSEFDPASLFDDGSPMLKRPAFYPIVSSATLAMTLARKSNGRVDGFIVEGPLAGGHNAPPRGPLHLSERGEPVYGDRDVPDLDKIRALGLPFWLAGQFAHPEKLAEAEALGAAGVQVGTAFAYCAESAIEPALKTKVLEGVRDGRVSIFTDPVASPTGFPFKCVRGVDGTATERGVYAERERVCDLGFLRHPYRREDGTVGYRCPAEPVEQYVRKGGSDEETHGRVCLCNGLLATVGLGRVRGGAEAEPPLLTAGDDLVDLARFFRADGTRYRAAEVIAHILSGASSETSPAG